MKLADEQLASLAVASRGWVEKFDRTSLSPVVSNEKKSEKKNSRSDDDDDDDMNPREIGDDNLGS